MAVRMARARAGVLGPRGHEERGPRDGLSQGMAAETRRGAQDPSVTAAMATPATALHARTGGLLEESPHLAPERPGAGIFPPLSDAGLITSAAMPSCAR